MRSVRTLVVDDEPAARDTLRHLLAADPEITLVGECASGRSALAALRACEPELLFLDVSMPEMDGFAVLEAAGRHDLPVVVFTTAYVQFALPAFRAHAVEYLLKPFTDGRFREALEHAKSQVDRVRQGNLGRRVAALVQDGQRAGPPDDAPAVGPRERLALRTPNGVVVLPMGTIDWVDADGDHVRVHAGKTAVVARQCIGDLERELDAARFLRIHRSTIVNLDRLKELQPIYRGDYVAILHDGTRLRVSRSRRASLEARLGRQL